MKRCIICLERKPSEDFSKSKDKKDGRMDRCKVCNRRLAAENYNKQFGTKEERETLQKDLYSYITDLRSQGYRLQQIAEATGLDKSSISYYLNGKRKVGMNAVRKYANHTKSIVDGTSD